MQYLLSLGVKDRYAISKEELWQKAGVSVSRLRANTATLAEEVHMDASQACFSVMIAAGSTAS
jgi:hypothetical protein